MFKFTLGVGARGTHETRVVGGHNKTNDEKVDDVKEGNAPEHLLARRGDALPRVVRLSSCQANKLGTAECKGCDCKYTRKPVKPILKRPGIYPVLRSEVSLVTLQNKSAYTRYEDRRISFFFFRRITYHTTSVDDNTQNDETSASRNLDHAEYELNFTITPDSKKLYNDQNGEEGGDPDGRAQVVAPVLDRD